MRTTLAIVEAFQDHDVAARLTDHFDLTAEDAEEIFLETRRWVWLCAEAREDRRSGIEVPPLVIDRLLYFLDEGWHNWILHTRAYRDFCQRHFGFYVDHDPTPKRIKDARRVDVQRDSAIVEELYAARERQEAYMIDKLGHAIVERWYLVLSRKYEMLSPRIRTTAS